MAPLVSLLALVAEPVAAQSPASGIQQHQQLRDQAQQEVVTKMKQSQEVTRPNVSPEDRRALEAEHAEELRQQRQRSGDQQRRQQQLDQSARPQPDPEQQRLLELQRQGFQREDASVPGPGPRPDPALPGERPD